MIIDKWKNKIVIVEFISFNDERETNDIYIQNFLLLDVDVSGALFKSSISDVEFYLPFNSIQDIHLANKENIDKYWDYRGKSKADPDFKGDIEEDRDKGYIFIKKGRR